MNKYVIAEYRCKACAKKITRILKEESVQLKCYACENDLDFTNKKKPK